MKTSSFVYFLLGTISFLFSVPVSEAAPSVDSTYGNIPLAFTVNEGQAPSSIRFTARGSGCGMAFSSSGTTFLLSRETAGSVARRAAKKSVVFEDDPTKDQPEYESFALNLSFIGANENTEIQGEDRLSWNNNYFIGNDPSQWRTDVPNYKKIRFKEVYSGIDLVYYGNQKRVKYDFVVKPGEDPEQILLKYDFGEAGGTLSVNDKGELVVKTPVGELVEEKPYCYQKINGKEVEIAIQYEVVEGGTYRFRVGEYDTGYDLVIDPEVVYSTYLGGAGDDFVAGIAVDSEGCAYITGETDSVDFPIISGSYDSSYKKFFITKINKAGTALLYSTFIGSTTGLNHVFSIEVDDSGDAYIAGWTQSSDFPTTSTAYKNKLTNTEAFVTKINQSGNMLIYSTFVGGSGVDAATGLDLDNQRNAYITGYTLSNDFPTTPGAYRVKMTDTNVEGFVTKLDSNGSSLIYSTFLGKTDIRNNFSIAVDFAGCAFVTGNTFFEDYPVTPEAYHHFQGGYSDIFVTCLNSDGTRAIYSTLFGGSKNDYTTGIAVDNSGSACVCGITLSSDFPTTSGSFQQKYSTEGENGFVLKLKVDGSGFEYSTFIGSDVGIYDIAVDNKGKAYTIGTTYNSIYPTTSDALYNLSYGVVLTIFSEDGSSIDYSTYFGKGDGKTLSIDNNGNIYIAGGTGSKVFPITPGAYDDSLAISTDESGTIITSQYDGFISKIHLNNNSTNINSSYSGPSRFHITSIYPNPFNPITTIEFLLPEPGIVTLLAYSVTGQKVKEINIYFNAGFQRFRFEGTDSVNRRLSSGQYFVHLIYRNIHDIKKMMIIK